MSANLSVDRTKGTEQISLPRGGPPPRVDVPPQPAPPKVSQAAPQNSVEAVKTRLSREERQKNLEEALSRLNEEMRKNDRSLQFSIDKELNRTVVRVKNPHTGEVIRQIPDETALRVAHSIEAVKGLLVDQLT